MRYLPRTGSLLPHLLFTGALVTSGQLLTAPANALTPEQVGAWREDLAFLDREASEQHPDLFHGLARETWESELARLSGSLPDLAPHEAVVELARIVAAVGDGHTRLTLPLAPGIDFFRGHSETPPPHDSAFLLRQLPLRLALFEDGLVVVAAEPANRNLLGAHVLRIGELSAEDATTAVSPTVQRDNEMGVKLRLPERLVLPEVLHARGVTASPGRAAFTVERAGVRETVTLSATPAGETVEWVQVSESGPTPLHLRHPERNFWLEPLPEHHTLYVRYRECYNEEDEAHRETIAAFAERILQALQASELDHLVLDLRGNPGGDNSLNRPLVHAMIRADKLRQPGRLFVLIDRGTFSAALMLSVDLERHTPAVFVGEPTGGKPNHFGDSRRIRLPRTGLTVRVSSLEWQYSDPRDERPWVPPHLPVAVRSQQALAGQDPVLDAVLEGIGPAQQITPGAWTGAISAGSVRLEMTLHLQENLQETHEGWSATADVPAQGMEGHELRNVRVDGTRFTFEVPIEDGGALPFEGRIERGWIVGTIDRDGRDVGVFLRRPVP